jgi:hypothetical protein
VRLIPLDTNVGFARAINIGFRRTRSQLVSLNSDTIVSAAPSIAIVACAICRVPPSSGRLVDGNGAVELSFGRMMGPRRLRRNFSRARTTAARRRDDVSSPGGQTG